MVKVFFQNYQKQLGVSAAQPLWACNTQVLEIFQNLPFDDGSFLVIINSHGDKIKMSGYNKFVWKIDIPIIKKQGAYRIFLPKEKCISFIEQIYQGIPPNKINGLSFESFK